MRIMNVPPLADGATSANDTDSLLEDHPAQTIDGATFHDSQLVKGQTVPAGDINRLFKQMEFKLESVVERLLLSKAHENDNILTSMQGVMERIFVTSAMRMSQGNISRAARLLGINRNTLSKKLRAIETGG
jgi:transcriptional regulator of acetoin/glycerol metabolism